MSSQIHNLTFDCARPRELGRFWSDVTGWPLHQESNDQEALLEAPSPLPGMLFLCVPEGKAAKNRLHFDLSPTDRTRDEEVRRLCGLGATVVADHRKPDGTGWAYLADPEGNEFCVEQSITERDA